MMRLVLVSLFVDATAVVLHEGGMALKLTPMETGCYYEEDPGGSANWRKTIKGKDGGTEAGGAKGRSYRGLVSNAGSGHVCRNWVSGIKDFKMKATPDLERDGFMKWGNGLGNHNYCRNPDPADAMTKPWCYTMDAKGVGKKEACNIDPCGEKKDYVALAKALTKTMMSTESTGNCMCEHKVLKASGSEFTAKDLGLGGPAFLQKSRMGQTKDGKPCSCER
jgi:hypothetical protein